MILTNEMITGLSTQHLINMNTNQQLHPAAANAFTTLQQAAKTAGFNLQSASAFRSFTRQQTIWNEKFSGQRATYDSNSQRIDLSQLNTQQKCLAIMRWSALPGTSRHHWGSDLDIYDPDLLPKGRSLQLTPNEFLSKGYFAPLTEWLSNTMLEYGFYRPYAHDRGGVATEPWHISYIPLAQQISSTLTPEILLQAWKGKRINGEAWLKKNLEQIFVQYIHNVDPVLT